MTVLSYITTTMYYDKNNLFQNKTDTSHSQMMDRRFFFTRIN